MKPRSDWLDKLAASARSLPIDVPEPLPRTQARVLAAFEKPSRHTWKPLLGGLATCVIVAMSVWFWTCDKSLPPISEAALADLESVEWTPPSDALLADASASTESGLRQQITELLTSP